MDIRRIFFLASLCLEWRQWGALVKRGKEPLLLLAGREGVRGEEHKTHLSNASAHRPPGSIAIVVLSHVSLAYISLAPITPDGIRDSHS